MSFSLTELFLNRTDNYPASGSVDYVSKLPPSTGTGTLSSLMTLLDERLIRKLSEEFKV